MYMLCFFAPGTERRGVARGNEDEHRLFVPQVRNLVLGGYTAAVLC